MTLQLDLSPELERRLQAESDRQKQPADELALRLLDQHLPPANRRAAAVEMLQQWAVEDEELTTDECAKNAALLQSLDKVRPSYRKLFSDSSKDEPE